MSPLTLLGTILCHFAARTLKQLVGGASTLTTIELTSLLSRGDYWGQLPPQFLSVVVAHYTGTMVSIRPRRRWR